MLDQYISLTAEINDAKVSSSCPETMAKEILSPSLDPTELFFQDTLKYGPLTPEETKSLLKDVVAGREAVRILALGGINSLEEKQEQEKIVREASAARGKLALHNLRFVHKVARLYKGLGIPLTDLVSAGTTGLLVAIDRYDPAKAINHNDPTKETTFLTFAGYRVKQRIQQFIDNCGRAIRIPSENSFLLRRIKKVSDLLLKTSGQKPSPEQIGEKVGLTAKRVKVLLAQDQKVLSLNQTSGEDGDLEMGDLIEDKESLPLDDFIDQRMLEFSLEEIFDALPPREVRVLQLRFGLIDGKAHTHEEIGKLMSIEGEEEKDNDGNNNGNKQPRFMTMSHERARQLEEAGLSRLRELPRASRLRPFYDGKEE